MPKHKWPICRSTGKRRFGERKDALLALRAAAMVRSRAEADGAQTTCAVVRAYRCSTGCGGWHLTSKAARPSPARADT